MKRVALLLLLAAISLYAVATSLQTSHPAWGYVAAFAGAATVGGIADWFAVVALFRRPLGLPIAHTAIIVRNQAKIGRNLAQFMVTHFLAADQLQARLASFDVGQHLADWLSDQQGVAALTDRWAGVLGESLARYDGSSLQHWVVARVQSGLHRLDVARLSAGLLRLLMRDGHHQVMLDGVLLELARLLATERVQSGISEAIAREVKALRYIGLDQVAAQLATRKVIVMVARTMLEIAEDPKHPLRLHFDGLMRHYIQRLHDDPMLRTRVQGLFDQWLSSAAAVAQIGEFWNQLVAHWRGRLRDDPAWVRGAMEAIFQSVAERLSHDDGTRRWLNEQVGLALPLILDRWRDAIGTYIETRVTSWDARQMSDELERHLGRDLQFIRINGTLVGGLAGLVLHVVTQWLH